MFAFLIALHVVAAVLCIVIIIVQPGKGGGLGGIFGEGGTQTIFGARANTFLNRLTVAFAVFFLFTCLSLGLIIGRRQKSLFDLTPIQVQEPEAADFQPAVPESEETVEKDTETKGEPLPEPVSEEPAGEE